ncbi:MAG: hypothetical protein QM733_04310 [Ilumatobacteraceae bacterium]
MDVRARLPLDLFAVVYDGRMVPGQRTDIGLAEGANCQRFAYAVLQHFGFCVPPWRSSELWDDTELSEVADRAEPLDLALFARTGDPWGAHVGVVVDDDRVLHLCAEVGRPTVWGFAKFADRARYRTRIGFKRFGKAGQRVPSIIT